jgi:3-methylcrotonyl-CoA carboxylase alpha subunit
VASGESLPLPQSALRIDGHAIEARIYAEDPGRGFLPSTGRLTRLAFPAGSADVRVDAGVVEGGIITPHYDAMIAKLVVRGATRDEALHGLQQALARCRIVGVANNVAFLERLVHSRSFVAADLDTALIEREADALFAPPAPPSRDAWLTAAAAWLAGDPHPVGAGPGGFVSPWADQSGWRGGVPARRELRLESGASSAGVTVSWHPRGWSIDLEARRSEVRARWRGPWQLDLEIDGHRSWPEVVREGLAWHLFGGASRHRIEVHDPLAPRAAGAGREGHLRAPMPGRIVTLFAEAGRHYARGAPLLVLEAMKMEHTIVAPAGGRLEACHVAVGDQVDEGTELVTFEAASGEG